MWNGNAPLVVQYGDGYTGREGLAIAANGQREFASMIPHDWSSEKLLEFLLAPSKASTASYPTWKVRRAHTGDQCCLTLRTPLPTPR